MTRSWRVSRRTVLRGVGASIALPLLDAMVPSRRAFGAAQATVPRRMAIAYVPNGAIMQDWTPITEGPGFELPYILEPLAKVRNNVSVLSGLGQKHAAANGDGPGDHARASAAFLTGAQPRKTSGADIRVGVSVDQIAAERVGQTTRFASLELGCEAGAQAGQCDSGYSCAYSSNIAWRSETTPVAKEINPRAVFERLFGGAQNTGPDRVKHQKYDESILDFVLEDASGLRNRLGIKDARKLDEYLTAVRDVERRIHRVEMDAAVDLPSFAIPTGIPRRYEDHARIMGDLLALAFQADLTRVATLVYANEGSNREYTSLGIHDGHHELSHHGGDRQKQEKIRQINHFHMTHFAYLCEKLAAIPEGDGTLLDHSMIVYGSGIGDGNRHNHDDLPILLVGGGGGTLRSGRHLKYPIGTPLNDLYLSMLDRLGATMDKFGDGDERLPGLS